MTPPIDLAAVRARSVEARAWLRTYDESSTQPSYTTGVIMRDLAEKADAMADEIEALRKVADAAKTFIADEDEDRAESMASLIAALKNLDASTDQPHRTAEEKAR